MEKKTIGQFIAVLRKSNGLTQKDLAEELNVSDKTISHWERDESAPDLSLIPVIADLFGVTSDEILRGERRPAVGKAAAESDADSPEDAQGKPDRRTDRQLKVLLDRIRVQFLTHSLIATGIGVLGLIAALTLDVAAWETILGFFVGMALYVAAIVTETVFIINTRATLTAEDFEGDRLDACRKAVNRTACTTYSILAGLFVFTLPMAADGPTEEWLLCGTIVLLILAAVWGVVFLIMKWNVIRDAAMNDRLSKLKGICALFTVLALLVTFGAQWALNEFVLLDKLFAPRQTIDSVEEFVEFAESSSDENYITEKIITRNNKLLRTFELRNDDLLEWSYEWDDEGGIVFTILTIDDLVVGGRRASIFNIAYCALYAAEIAAGFIVYFKLKKKRRNA